MRILICTGIYPPDIGGPAEYAKNLADEFLRRKHAVRVLSYRLEKKLPTSIRHFFYFLRLIFNLRKIDLIIALDTFSVGLPAVLAAKMFNKKIVIRTGGDFLWESYIERTGNLIALRQFYEKMPRLSLKEKIIFSLSKFILRNCSGLIFSTEWQRAITEKVYKINSQKSFIIENFYGEKMPASEPAEKNFVFAGRLIKLKNLEILKQAFNEATQGSGDIKLEIISKMPHSELIKKLQSCYAVILPSLSEISPNFILDAIRINKPFILTRETGFYDKLKDIGVFVDPLDKEDIKNKILFLAAKKNYDEYKKKVSNFKFTHSWQEIINEFLSIYKKL